VCAARARVTQAAMVDRWSAEDLSSDKVFRQMAETQLGPFLQV
jgi:hypothetical protein